MRTAKHLHRITPYSWNPFSFFLQLALHDTYTDHLELSSYQKEATADSRAIKQKDTRHNAATVIKPRVWLRKRSRIAEEWCSSLLSSLIWQWSHRFPTGEILCRTVPSLPFHSLIIVCFAPTLPLLPPGTVGKMSFPDFTRRCVSTPSSPRPQVITHRRTFIWINAYFWWTLQHFAQLYCVEIQHKITIWTCSYSFCIYSQNINKPKARPCVF